MFARVPVRHPEMKVIIMETKQTDVFQTGRDGGVFMSSDKSATVTVMQETFGSTDSIQRIELQVVFDRVYYC